MPIPPILRGLRRNHYVEVAADVPWKFVTRSKKGITSRSPESKYETMSLQEIAALPVSAYAAENARLWFWVTGPFLAAGAHIPIMEGWGFKPTAMGFTWLKPNAERFEQGQLFLESVDLWKIGTGYTTRKNCEFVVIGRRGNPPKPLARDIREEIVEPAREHSRKPEQFYERVERYGSGPYLELFGRTRRKGWTVRGNQLGMFEDQ